jgi:hypothetical protein
VDFLSEWTAAHPIVSTWAALAIWTLLITRKATSDWRALCARYVWPGFSR